MILPEVLLQGIVVDEVVRMSRVSPVADEASFMFHAAMLIEFVVVVEPLTTETTKRVALEAGLVRRPWLIIAVSHMPLKLLFGKQFVLVREHPLVPRAEIAHALFVR